MARAKRKVTKAPIDARTFEDICAMPRDNVEAEDFWMITDGYEVTIADQKSGAHPTQKISLPRDVFDAFVKWYVTGRFRKPSRKAA